MFVKRTGQDFTCVRLIPTLSDGSVHFLTTDSSGHVCFYEKTNSRNQHQESAKLNKQRRYNDKIQRKSRLLLVPEGDRTTIKKKILTCASILNNNHYLISTSSKDNSSGDYKNSIVAVRNDLNDDESPFILQASDVPSTAAITSISNITNSHDQVYITAGADICSMQLKTGTVNHITSNHGVPITKIMAFNGGGGGGGISKNRTENKFNLSTAGELDKCFIISDVRGQLSLFDSRTKKTVFHYKCGAAPALLGFAKTNNMYGSSSIIATAAENGQVSLYDLRMQKVNASPLFDKKCPLPVYDLAFSKSDPSYLYTCGLNNITSIHSTMPPSVTPAGEFFMDPWLNNSEHNLSNSSFGMNTSDVGANTTPPQEQLGIQRKILYHSENSCFKSLDVSDNGDLVCVSDDGLIVYTKSD